MELAQTLHGYRDGHRLLESSISIAETDKRQMLILSDLSGASSAEKIDSYITGYPLQSSNFYVLAKTWYAEEMDRPGCVWTHSILIPLEHLSFFSDISCIAKLFIRPQLNDLSEYSKSISFNENPLDSNKEIIFKDEEVLIYKELIYSLYSEQTRPFILISNFPAEMELLILNFWIKQWPDLRKSFSFSTGSLSNRKIFGRNFDFQITNKENASEFAKPSLNYKLFDRYKKIEKNEYSKWVEISLDFILSGKMIKSRIKEDYFYKKLEVNKDNYAAYAFFELTIRNNLNIVSNSALIELIKESGLSSRLINKLYEILFSSSGLLSFDTGIRSVQAESRLLCEIISNNSFNEVSAEILNLQLRLKKILDINTDLILEPLIEITTRNLSAHSLEFFAIVSGNIKSKDLNYVLDKNFQVGLFLASQNFFLVCNKEIWIKNNNYQFNELLRASLSNKELSTFVLTDLLFALLDANNDTVIESMYKVYGKSIVADILKWSSFSERLPEKGWLKLLHDNPNLCLLWLNNVDYCNKNILIFLCEFLDPLSVDVRILGIEKWVSIINLNLHHFNNRDYQVVSEFALPLSLTFEGPIAKNLALFSYYHVVDEKNDKIHSFRAWTYLENILPEVSWYESWDRVVRIRKFMKRKGFL